MTFTITYRGKDGAKADVQIDESTRAACMAECRARGLIPIGIREGGSAAKISGKPRRMLSRKCIVISASALVAAFLVCAGFWFLREEPPSVPTTEKSTAVARQDQPPSKPCEATSAVPVITNAHTVKATVETTKRAPSSTNVVKVLSVVTNSNGTVVERYLRADGKKIRLIKPAPQLFKHGSDDVLAMIATTPPGREMPPLPPGAFTKEQFLQSLNDPIVITDEDTEHVKLVKQSVTALREEMKALLDQGQSVEQILADHQKLHQENVEVRTQALLEVKKLLDAGDRKEAIRYATTVNAVLQQMGIEALPVPAEAPSEDSSRRMRPHKREGENK